MAQDMIELHTGQFSALLLRINSGSLTAIKRALKRKFNAPSRQFTSLTAVLQFSPLLEKVDLNALKALLEEYHISLIGVTNWQTPLQKELILTAQLPALGSESQIAEILPDYRYMPPLIVEQDVKPQQVIYAKNRDLVIYGDVLPESEVLSDGIIHIYGRLQGRAVAGVNGKQGMIYTQSLEAEFLSVNQRFIYQEKLPEAFWQKPVRISAEKDGLTFSALLKDK